MARKRRAQVAKKRPGSLFTVNRHFVIVRLTVLKVEESETTCGGWARIAATLVVL